MEHMISRTGCTQIQAHRVVEQPNRARRTARQSSSFKSRIDLEDSLLCFRSLRSSKCREGIEDRDYLAESKGIFGIPKKVSPILNPQKAWLLADVFGR